MHLVELIPHLPKVARMLADQHRAARHRRLCQVVAAAALQQAVAYECDFSHTAGSSRGRAQGEGGGGGALNKG